ncbi:MAG TPA: hypothetical protein VMV10_12910 [Pirellulales bacterium]|nr:hypothetical protein [Pirellulales bacterium]
MQIQCVHCGKQYSLRDENVGSQFACRSCGKLSPISAPKPDESAVVGPPLPAAVRQAAVRQAAPASPADDVIETQCRHCGKQYKVRAAAGAQFKCKQCGRLSAVASPSPPQPTERVLKALPQRARPAPPAAIPARAAPLAARPAAPAARPAQARLVAMPEEPVAAELVAEPIEASSLVSPGMLDLLNEASLPAAASPYGLTPAEARPLPRSPAPPPRKPKHQRNSGPGFDGEKLGLVLGGAFFICVGIGLVALGIYGVQNGYRRPFRAIVWGGIAIFSGFMMVIGRPITRD